MIFKRHIKMTEEQMRELIPRRVPHVEWESLGDEIRLTIIRSPGRLESLLSPFFTLPARKSFMLDRHGARVWESCDGKTPVRGIVAALACREGWSETQAERAVLQFLAMLSQRRLLSFFMPVGEESKGGEKPAAP